MKATVKKETKKVERKLKHAFVLWKNTGKSGLEYLSGNTSEHCGELAGASVTGFFNSKKENPKAPDIKIYVKGEDDKNVEIAALWEKVTKNEKRILTGLTNEKEKLVGFYNKSDKENAPYLNVYFED